MTCRRSSTRRVRSWTLLCCFAISAAEGQIERRLQQSAPLEQRAESFDGIRSLPGFKVELIYQVPRAQGSWISITFDPKGRLIASSQPGGFYRMTLHDRKVEKLDIHLGGESHGMVYAFGSLYATASGRGVNGVYRIRDTTGNDAFDDVKRIVTMGGPGGEHGPHAIRRSPDGKSLYFIAGNFTHLPENTTSGPAPPVWQEDILLPRLWDPLGHAREMRAPGGWVCRMDPSGKEIEVYATGFRNPYDIAFNREGELFTFDSDMERDTFLPWYRANRILHITSGAEFGWRSGSGKWLPTFPDSLPAVCDIGLGSPTGVIFGHRSSFPSRYREALFALDWTHGRIFAVHLQPAGSSYTATYEEFLSGRPLPVTDAEFAPDGSMVFVVGGRGASSRVFRVTYEGDSQGTNDGAEKEKPAEPEKAEKNLSALRHSLEASHGRDGEPDIRKTLAALAHVDRHVRYAARLALEHQPVERWAKEALALTPPRAVVACALAVARTGDAGWRPATIAALTRLDFSSLPPTLQADLARAYALALIRWGMPDKTTKASVLAALDPHFPTDDYLVDYHLAELLVFLEAPAVIPRTLDLAEQAAIGEHVIHYAKTLRLVKSGWTPDLRRRYFSILGKMTSLRGGEHVIEKTSRVLQDFEGYLKAIVGDALATVPKDERASWQKALETSMQSKATSPAPVVKPKGPGKAWTTAELTAVATQEALARRDLVNGRRMYAAAACATCHRIGNEGGVIGPNLTGVANRFTVAELIEAIVEPSKVISDQFGMTVIKTKSGDVHVGRIVQEAIEIVRLSTDPDDPKKTIAIKADDIRSIEHSPVSPMPPALINAMNQDEVLDLLAYVLSGGVPGAK